MKKARVAVIMFPGNNCEVETREVLRLIGCESEILRWNEDPKIISSYDGYVLPGGWSYEDRVRAGVIASKNTIMNLIKERAAAGMPVLGICNGAQVLIESGLVPGITGGVDMALAPNSNPRLEGFYCTWVNLRVCKRKENAFNKYFEDGQVVQMPIAHAEGRFTTIDKHIAHALEEQGLIAFVYCDNEGDASEEFPVNPNGSMMNIAALTNKEGNIMAIMPHPERASFNRQVPGFQGALQESSSGFTPIKIFESMRDYILEK